MSLEELTQHVHRYLSEYAPAILSGEEMALVAVSRGVDSMVLCHVFLNLRAQYGISFALVHINHRLRPASEAEQEAVIADATKYDIPLFVRIWHREADVSGSYEELARQFRYENFATILKQHQWRYLFTAHHLDDQAETIVMRFINGYRVPSLRGMEAASPLYTYPKAQLMRPFLTVTKATLRTIAEEEQILYAEDESNADTRFLRNDIRHHMLPEMATINPNVSSAIVEMAGELTGWLTFAKRAIDVQMAEWLTREGDHYVIALKAFKAYHKEEQWVMLQCALEKIDEQALTRFTRRGLQQLAQFLSDEAPQGEWHLPDDYIVLKIYHTAYIGKRASLDRLFKSSSEARVKRVAKGCQIKLGDQVTVTIIEEATIVTGDIIRHRQAGDYVVLTNGQRKKLRRWFIDQKIPQHQREQAWLLANGSLIKAIIVEDTIAYVTRELKDDIQLKLP